MTAKNLASAFLVAVLTLVFADLANIVWQFAGHRTVDQTRPVFDTPSVPSFGYSDLRPGSVESSLTASNYTPLTVRALPALQGSSNVMPVYFNGTVKNLPGMGHRKIIFFGTAHHLNAFDPETRSLIWSVEVPLPNIDQTPFLDVKRGKIYFTASGRSGGEAPAPWARGKWNLQVFSVNLDGSELQGKTVDLDQLVFPEQLNGAVKPSHLMRCRTALGLNDQRDSHYLFWGCGMDAQSAPFQYGNMRGARGVLVAAYLDDEGDFVETGTFAAYTPSPMTANPRTGYDSGIWNSGAGPSLLPDATLLLASGNGPFLPEEGNFGCSVVRLDAVRLEPTAGQEGSPPFYSVDDRGYNECHGSNMDLSSSSVASIEHEGRIYSAITGKDGNLKVFDPNRLPGDDPELKHEKLLGRVIVGQPVMLFDVEGNVQTVAGGGQLSFGFFRNRSDIVVGTAAVSGMLEKRGFKKQLCLGLVGTHGGAHRRELGLHYSGRLRNDYVALPMGTEIQQLLSSGEFPYNNWVEAAGSDKTGKTDPYRNLQPLGYTLNPNWDIAPPGYEFSALKIYASKKGGLYSFAEGITLDGVHENRLLEGRQPVLQENGGLFRTSQANGQGYCGNIETAGYQPLYLYQFQGDENRDGWEVSSFTISENLEMTRKWTYLRNDGARFPNTSMAATYSGTGEPGLVVLVAEKARYSYLVLLNAETGQLVDEIPFHGKVTFSMPLIVNEQIYLATSGGILVFDRSDGLLEFTKRKSVILNLWK